TGLPRNLRDPPASFSTTQGRDDLTQQSWPPAGAGLVRRDEHRRTGWYRPGVVKSGRDGREEVAVPHSTSEAGELASRGPCRGKGAPGQRSAGGTHGTDTEPWLHVNGTTADSGVGRTVPADG